MSARNPLYESGAEMPVPPERDPAGELGGTEWDFQTVGRLDRDQGVGIPVEIQARTQPVHTEWGVRFLFGILICLSVLVAAGVVVLAVLAVTALISWGVNG